MLIIQRDNEHSYHLYHKLKKIMNKKYALNAKTLPAFTSSVKEVLNYKSVSLSIFLCLIALGIIFLSSSVADKSSSIYMGGICMTIVLLIVGFYRLINKRTKLVYVPTNSTMISGSFYFDKIHLDKMKNLLSSDYQVDLNQFKFAKSGNSRLDYVVSSDRKFVTMQIYEFIPYNFEVASDVICYENEKASVISDFLLENHGKL